MLWLVTLEVLASQGPPPVYDDPSIITVEAADAASASAYAIAHNPGALVLDVQPMGEP